MVGAPERHAWKDGGPSASPEAESEMTGPEEAMAKVTELLAMINAGRVTDAADVLADLRGCRFSSLEARELVEQGISLAEETALSYDYVSALAEGRLRVEPPRGAPALDHFRELHAMLHNLVQQLDRMADGESADRADLMGDFARACDRVRAVVEEKKGAEERSALAERRQGFLNDLTSHDVMSHLTALNGHLELAGMKCEDPAVRKHLESAFRSAAAIQAQLELARAYQAIGAAEPGWIDVRPCLEKELEAMDLGQVSLEVDLPEAEVLAGPLFISVIQHMVRNALEHGKMIRRVRIIVREEAKDMVIVVEDDGVGVMPMQKKAIFEWSHQGRSGHGLHLAWEILSSYGMGVRETGTEGEGARFEIVVPVGKYRMIKSEGLGPSKK